MRSADRGLAEFLRARRDVVTPEQVGLAPGGDRRVAGLRRDEVALLAGVSTDYYVRLEQGREARPSEQVLGALARALDLDHDAADHLYRLGLPHPGETPAATVVSDEVARLLESLATVPAFVLDPALDVLAANDLARRLYASFERFDNLLRMIFLDPAARAVDFYRARIELRPVTDAGATFVSWSIVFAARPGEAEGLAGALHEGIVRRGLRGLADHLATVT